MTLKEGKDELNILLENLKREESAFAEQFVIVMPSVQKLNQIKGWDNIIELETQILAYERLIEALKKAEDNAC